MFAQTAEDPVEHLCGELHATKLDAEIIRAYFKIDSKIVVSIQYPRKFCRNAQ